MKLKKELLQKLPFRLIIGKILIHVIYDTTKYSHKEFDCFGYFINDKFRKCFGIFRSVIIDCGNIILPIGTYYITIRNLESNDLKFLSFYKNVKSLEIHNLFIKSSIKFEALNIFKLNSLSICQCNFNTKCLDILLKKKFLNLSFQRIEQFQENFLCRRFNSIIKIEIVDIFLTHNGMFLKNHCKSLKRIVLVNTYINDEVFRKCKFKSLRFLLLREPIISGDRWKRLQNLREFKLICCRNFENNIFAHQQFESIESIEIRGCDKITGLNWNKFSKLSKLSVSYSDKFSYYSFIRNLSLKKIKSINLEDNTTPIISILFPKLPNMMLFIKKTFDVHWSGQIL